MADWKVSREQITVMAHPNAERLEVCKCGQYQLVTQKGLYKDGEIVIFVPDKSVLPDVIADDGDMRKYLVGPLKNRVKAIKLRQELSCGIVLSDRADFKDIPVGENISDKLNIVEYAPPIPVQLQGKVKPVGNIDTGGAELTKHDVEHFLINQKEFVHGERVICTEKIHGTQIICCKTRDGRRLVSSKGLFRRQLTLEDDGTNTYWNVANKSKVFDVLDSIYPGQHVQVFGEVLHTQPGFTYGLPEPDVRWFRIDLEGKRIFHDSGPKELMEKWVPILYDGPFDVEKIRTLRDGSETISGKALHIREGIVVAPCESRRDQKGNFELIVKLINPAYKETGEEFN